MNTNKRLNTGCLNREKKMNSWLPNPIDCPLAQYQLSWPLLDLGPNGPIFMLLVSGPYPLLCDQAHQSNYAGTSQISPPTSYCNSFFAKLQINWSILSQKYMFSPFQLDVGMLLQSNSSIWFFLCSQPPLLSSMVLEIYSATGDLDLVKKAFPSLLKEHSFWMSGLLLNSANIWNVISITLFEALFMEINSIINILF